jgi:hypothetical protein
MNIDKECSSNFKFNFLINKHCHACWEDMLNLIALFLFVVSDQLFDSFCRRCDTLDALKETPFAVWMSEELKIACSSILLLGSTVCFNKVVSGFTTNFTLFIRQLDKICETFGAHCVIDFEIHLHENGINNHLDFFICGVVYFSFFIHFIENLVNY